MARSLVFTGFRWPVMAAGYRWVDCKLGLSDFEEQGANVAAFVDQMSKLPRFTEWTGEPLPEGKGPLSFLAENRDGPLPFLMPRPGNDGLNFYKPLGPEHSGLFRIFAETEPTREGILKFANHYGSLGDGAQAPVIPAEYDKDSESVSRWLLRLDDSSNASLPRYAEPFGAWCHQILAMRRVVGLWDMIKRRNEGDLAKRVAWFRTSDGKVHVSYDSDCFDPPELLPTPFRDYLMIASDEKNPELLERFQPNDLYGPAWVYIERVINSNLARRASAQSKWDNPKNDRLPFRIVPNGLLGALWLQLALAVDGDKDYRQCKQCLSWFEVSPAVGRTSKRYCGNACRIRAHRERQAQVQIQDKARRMRAGGKSLKEIAKELKTDEKTIKGWVANRKG